MTILAAGYGLRNLANQGMRSVAELEAQENAIADQLEAAEQAQKTQMYSTGAGIGGSYGVQKALEAGKAVATPAPVVEAVGTMEAGAGITEATLAAEGLATQAVAEGATQAAAEGAAAAIAEGAAAAEGATTAVAAAEGATTAVAAAEGTTVAAGASGGLATLGAIAAPIAIGLGVAFLLNKLFD